MKRKRSWRLSGRLFAKQKTPSPEDTAKPGRVFWPALPRRVRAFAVLGWMALFWETAASAILPLFIVIAFFLALALSGAAGALPPRAHVALLVFFAVLLIVVGYTVWRRSQLPHIADALNRVEKDSGLAHRPLTHLTDTQASNLVDPGARALWSAHRQRLLQAVGRLSLHLPKSPFGRHDPYRLWIIASLFLLAAIIDAGSAWRQRLWSAFDPNFAGYAQSDHVLIEAWITPPDYTGLPPISLRQATGEEDAGNAAAKIEAPIQVPAGSRLLIQAIGVGTKARLRIDDKNFDFTMIDPLSQRLEASIENGKEITVTGRDETLATWPIVVLSDQAPRVSFAHDPMTMDRGVLRLDYVASDDYGINDMRVSLQMGTEMLELPMTAFSHRPGEIRGSSFLDLTAHPWAGLDVEARLIARDALGQIGASAPRALTLPERKFFHPIAREIIALRKELVHPPETTGEYDAISRRTTLSNRLRFLNWEIDGYDGHIPVFLALSLAWRALYDEKVDPTLMPGLQQLLWDTALAIEDGGSSIALRDLRRLQQALADALSQGASTQDIEALIDELQQAMNDYLGLLGEQLRRNLAAGIKPEAGQDALSITRLDLNQMLNNARQMAQSGARDQARQTLNQLQRILENLQAGMPAPATRESSAAQQMMEALGQIAKRQQRLLEESFQGGRAREQKPGAQKNGPGGERTQENAAAQDMLRQDLGALIQRFSSVTNTLPQSLGQAEENMRDAIQALKQKNAERATEAQGEALDQLRQSLREMGQALQRQTSNGSSPGVHDQMDPFGHIMTSPDSSGGNATDSQSVPLPDDAALQKSRVIYDELRQRRNNPAMPRYERDYIDRLLKQF